MTAIHPQSPAADAHQDVALYLAEIRKLRGQLEVVTEVSDATAAIYQRRIRDLQAVHRGGLRSRLLRALKPGRGAR